jgi:serine/threonine protein kinase
MKAGDVLAEKYRLGKRLGLGGMGEVWSATHTAMGREFAVKLMHAHAATSTSARARFAKEARVSAKINHPSVIDVYDVGETEDGCPFLVMELLDGLTLTEAFHGTPPLSVRDFLAIMLDTAGALAAAHAVGVVHRDIKSSNIFLCLDRASGLFSPKVLDFGISKFSGNADASVTKTGAVLGSPRYMSPEQTRSAANVDHRADVWAMGVVLFEGLTGTWPHEGDSFSSLVVALCTTPPASIEDFAPYLPESVRSIVRDCLQPLDARLPSAEELAARLEAALQDPGLAQLLLPAPRQAPSDALRPMPSGLRIRPPARSLSTTIEQTMGPGSGRRSAPGIANPITGSGPHRISNPPSGSGPHRISSPPTGSGQYAMANPLTGSGQYAMANPLTGSGQYPAANPAFRPTTKTLALHDSAEFQAQRQAVNQGLSTGAMPRPAQGGPDLLAGTASAMSVEALGSSSIREVSRISGPPLRQPSASSMPPGPLAATSSGKLRWVAALLLVTLAAVVILAVSLLRASPATSPATSPLPSGEPGGAMRTTPAPGEAPALSATAVADAPSVLPSALSAAPLAGSTAAPASAAPSFRAGPFKGGAAKGGKPDSKIEALGSGL